jgi:site-specific DNA-cytosine methylase
MSDFQSEKSNKSSEFNVVITLAIAPHDEMRTLLRRIAEGDSIKQKINTAARRIGLSATRVRDLWYGTARRIEAAELDAARQAIAAQEAKTREATAGGRRASVAIGGNGKPKGNQGKHPDARLRNRPFAYECELQGLPADFLSDSPLTAEGKRVVVGNGVPLAMGRAVAAAVLRALEPQQEAA